MLVPQLLYVFFLKFCGDPRGKKIKLCLEHVAIAHRRKSQVTR
jgi:hypothetical protein